MQYQVGEYCINETVDDQYQVGEFVVNETQTVGGPTGSPWYYYQMMGAA